MIAYFSGTGNTEWVARKLSTLVCDAQLVNMAHDNHVDWQDVQILGILFPVHAWGIPSLVKRFITSIPQNHVIPYLYMVCTCGDDIGETLALFNGLMEDRGQSCSLACSVQMPNTYVNLPSFDVDPILLQKEKVRRAEDRLKVIAQRICQKEKVVDVVKGDFPKLKSGPFRSLFRRFLVKDSYFHFTTDCVGCGHCEGICPVGNIQIKDKHPLWLGNGNCMTCMACYHSCPKHAIRFGKFTDDKGQYLFKNLMH